MSLFGFSKRPIYRKFEYTPRHYDPAKEELQNRLASYDESIDKTELAKSRIQMGLRSKYRVDDGYKQTQKRKSSFRLLLIIIVLSMVTYMILQSDRLIRMIEAFN